MADEGTPKGWIPAGIVHFCDWFWNQRALVWGTIVFSIASGIFTGWLFADPSSVAKPPSYWFYEQRFGITIALLVLVFLFILSGVIRLVPVSKSEYALKRKYLDKLIGEQMMLALSGIPTGLVQQAIWLEKIFIHLHFHHAPPTNIQSLDEEEQARISQRRAKGSQVEVLTRLMIEARSEREIREAQTVDIAEVWQRLTRDEPAAVIQGYPGIGKSTLLSRITLCMARRSLRRPDPDTILSALQPAQIPLFVSLKEYAHSYNNKQCSLLDFIRDNVLPQLLPSSDAAAIAPHIEHWLDNGLCLVLFDGLDEAANKSDDMRRTVQKEIRQFIGRYRHRERTTGNYNRFLVTSRIAGYDRDAFLPDRYPNYIIAYLEEVQIAHFLPRWCTANVHPAEIGVSKETLQQQADKTAERLLQAVRTNRGVKKLAQTPLLLTLMAAMQ